MYKVKLLLLLLFPLLGFAQPFKFKSKGAIEPIELTLSWQNSGKGACVLYKGKTQLISLKVKSYTSDFSERDNKAPTTDIYKWLEMYKGKVTGEYGVRIMAKKIYDMYYLRYSDHKKIEFEHVEDKESYDGKDMTYLHGTRFDFYKFNQHQLSLKYANGQQTNILLDESPEDKPRYCIIADYNFDGIDDVAFVYNADEAINEIYNIFIYNAGTKKFNRLKLPDAEPEDKFTFCNLKQDESKKILSVSYKSGPSWYSHFYKFNSKGQLYLLKKDAQEHIED